MEELRYMVRYKSQCCPEYGEHIRCKLKATEAEFMAFDNDCIHNEECGIECELYDVNDKSIEDCFSKWLKSHRKESNMV